MRTRLCFRHPQVEAEAMCTHCHKPYCAECRVDTPYGGFCCFDCSGHYAAWKAKYKEPKLHKQYLVPFIAGVILLGMLALGAAWVGHNVLHIDFFRKFDLIGKFTS